MKQLLWKCFGYKAEDKNTDGVEEDYDDDDIFFYINRKKKNNNNHISN